MARAGGWGFSLGSLPSIAHSNMIRCVNKTPGERLQTHRLIVLTCGCI